MTTKLITGERSDKMSEIFERYLSLVLCGALLVIIWPVLAKTHKVQSVIATTTPASGSPLLFKTVTSGRACSETCVVIEASLTNTSSEDVAIDTVGMRYEINIRKFIDSPTGGSVQTMTKRGDYGPGQYNNSTYRVLKAGETYSTTLNFPLTDKFFRGKGSYKITFTYGQFREYVFQGAKLFKGTVESKALDFSVVACSSKEAKKSSRDCK